MSRFVYQFGTPMEPVFAAAKRAPKRVMYAEGKDERVLRAAQTAVDEGLHGRCSWVAPTSWLRASRNSASRSNSVTTVTASTFSTTRVIANTGSSIAG